MKNLKENIIDVQLYNEDNLLELFDKDNDYLSGWDKEQKIKWIKNWEEGL